MIDDGIAAILRRDHHWSGNFLQDGGEEIYRNGTEGSNPAYSGGESCELQPVSRGAHRAKRRTNLRSTVYCKARLMALRMPLIAAQNSASTAGKSPTEIAILFMVIPPPGQIGVSPFRISIPRKRQGHHHRTCPVHVEPREEVRR